LNAISRFVDTLSGPWGVGARDFQQGTAVIQMTKKSCVSACGEMLTDGRYSQEQFLQVLGDEHVTSLDLGSALDSVGEEWFVRYHPAIQEVDMFASRGSIGAGLYTKLDSNIPGHMVVIDKVADGDYLVRDPWPPGYSYHVDVNWIEKWVKEIFPQWPRSN
jgi:hypothetical protein